MWTAIMFILSLLILCSIQWFKGKEVHLILESATCITLRVRGKTVTEGQRRRPADPLPWRLAY